MKKFPAGDATPFTFSFSRRVRRQSRDWNIAALWNDTWEAVGTTRLGYG
jgi:hypothetical protein